MYIRGEIDLYKEVMAIGVMKRKRNMRLLKLFPILGFFIALFMSREVYFRTEGLTYVILVWIFFILLAIIFKLLDSIIEYNYLSKKEFNKTVAHLKTIDAKVDKIIKKLEGYEVWVEELEVNEEILEIDKIGEKDERSEEKNVEEMELLNNREILEKYEGLDRRRLDEIKNDYEKKEDWRLLKMSWEDAKFEYLRRLYNNELGIVRKVELI